MRTLIPFAALLLAAACTAPTETAGSPAEDPPSPSVLPRTWDTLPKAELSASTTVAAEEYVPPEPAPEGPAPGVSYEECMEIWQDASLCSGGDPEGGAAPPPDDGIPSIDEQIRQCTEQTGLPQECEDKIRHGIP